MGCLFSKNGEVRTLSDDVEEPLPASAFSTRGAAHAWLQEIGLAQYAPAFDDAGFSDWDLLSCLTEADLDAITAHTGTRIPPGHRKKLLMASRQMGATAPTAPGSALPYGSVRRYSHSSNPGNGNNSRASGLAAAAAAVVSLERRSNGLRPNSSSRVPSLANVHPGQGQVLGPGHPPHLLLPLAGTPSRNATEDGLVSGRRSRGVGVTVPPPSRNSSRNSLVVGAAVGHYAIGYIASSNMVGGLELGGGADPWVMATDGRRSPAEPGSPSAAVLTAALAGGPTPSRQRRRWSANKCASRGVLVGGGGGAGGAGNVPASASSYGWLETETAASALGGAGPITDVVRQISMTSSIGDAFGGVGAVNVVPSCLSRDLDSLVMGAEGGANRAMPSRCQTLAARPDRSCGGGGGGCSGSGLPSSPPQQQRGPTGGGGGSAASPSPLGDLPYVRGSMRQAVAIATAAAATASPPRLPAGHSQSQPNLDGPDPRQTPSKHQPRVSSARDGGGGTAANGPAAGGGGGGASWGIGLQASPSLRRPGSAADAAAKVGTSPSPPSRPTTGASYASASAAIAAAAPPPGVAWPSQCELHAAADSVNSAAAAAAAAARPHDGDVAFPSPSGARSAGSPGGALPRFVRALAGWAIPAPAGSVVSSGAAVPGVAHDGDGVAAATGARRARSSNRQRRAHQRQSAPQAGRPPARACSDVKGAGEAPEASEADRHVRGDVLGAAAGAAAGSPAGPPPALHAAISGGRSRRQMMVPDALASRGVWDQDAALCIRGRGYKPSHQHSQHHRHTAERGPVMRQAAAAGGAAAAAAGRDSTGTGDEDSDTAPSSASRPASGLTGGPAGSYAAATAAARGGGWPFVLPQLPQPARATHADAAGPAAAPPCGGGGRTGPGASSAAEDLAPSSGSYGAPAGGGPPPASAVFGKMNAVPESPPLPSVLLESIASDVSAATTARRAPPVHSSRPRDWYPSVGGTSEGVVTSTATAAELSGGGAGALLLRSDADAESSADESALCGSSSATRPHRVQIVSSAMAMAAPYNAAGVAAAGQFPRAAAAAAAQWPVMPLQPPSRAKPAPPAAAAAAAGGVMRSGPGAAAAAAQMEVLTSEAPGPSCVPSAAPPGAGGAGPSSSDLPRPTPGRKLDLEMLADQVGRIMGHLSNITREGGEEQGGEAAPPAATAAPASGGGGGGDNDAGNGAGRRGGSSGGGDDAMEAQYGGGSSSSGGGGGAELAGASSLRPGTRLHAIDQKRLELQHLHQDLVRRVAAMATDSPPPPPVAAPASDGAAGRAGSGRQGGGGGAAEPSAADALAEVEARIRSKLTELATLTMRPDPDGRTGPAAAAASGGGGGDSAPGAARKRALGPDSAVGSSAAAMAAAAGWDGAAKDAGGAGGGGGAAAATAGRQRAREEAALHMEVLAVLGARKRQVRGASTAATATAGPGGRRGSSSEDGLHGQGQLRQPPARPAPAGGGGLACQRSPASAAPARAARGGGGGGSGGGRDAAAAAGAVLADMHDALRAELLAIDSKIKARVLGPGAAAASRRA